MKSIATVAACLLISGAALAQAPTSPRIPPLEQKPKGPPSFFVTSVGGGKGADLGGLEGADNPFQHPAQARGRRHPLWAPSLRAPARHQERPEQPWCRSRPPQRPPCGHTGWS